MLSLSCTQGYEDEVLCDQVVKNNHQGKQCIKYAGPKGHDSQWLPQTHKQVPLSKLMAQSNSRSITEFTPFSTVLADWILTLVVLLFLIVSSEMKKLNSSK